MKRFCERDEVARDQPGALMDQLIEGVLTICSRLAPVDWPSIAIDLGSIQRDMLAVAFHRQLLQVRREPLQVLLVG